MTVAMMWSTRSSMALGVTGRFWQALRMPDKQFFAGKFLMPAVALQHHQPFVLDFLVGGEAVIAGGTFAAAADGRAFTGGA